MYTFSNSVNQHKMESDTPVSIPGVGTFSTDSTISELISFTRSAFRSSDFDTVERILQARELKLKTKYDKMYESHGLAVLEKLEMEEKLKKTEKALNDKDATIARLNSEIVELKSCQSKAESEIDAWKKNYVELDQRLLCLEEELETCVNGLKLPAGGETEVKDVSGDEKLGHAADQHSVDVDCGNGSPAKKQLVSKSGSCVKKLGIQCSGDIIILDGSDDDDVSTKFDGTESFSKAIERRKQSSEPEFKSDDGNCKVDGTKSFSNAPDSTNKRKQSFETEFRSVDDDNGEARKKPTFIRRCQENHEVRCNTQVVYSSSESDTGTCNIENLPAEIQRKKKTQVWALEVDMRRAYERDDELCLNAVCALYRQMHSIKNQGINPFDAQRVSALAERLIDGDPQRKLKKSCSELKKTDPKSMDECRKLAFVYSKHLFEIYKNAKDPYFRPNKDQ